MNILTGTAYSLYRVIQFDCEGYALSDTFYRIEIELLVFKLCPVYLGSPFFKLSSGCSSEWKSSFIYDSTFY